MPPVTELSVVGLRPMPALESELEREVLPEFDLEPGTNLELLPESVPELVPMLKLKLMLVLGP